MAERSLDDAEETCEEPGAAPDDDSAGIDSAGVDVGRGAQIVPFPAIERRRRAPEAEPDTDVRLRDVLGRVLREERLDQDRTLAEVADAANVSLPYLSEVERGVKEVSSDLLHAIADALELPLDDVLERAVRHIRSGSVGGSGVTMLAA